MSIDHFINIATGLYLEPFFPKYNQAKKNLLRTFILRTHTLYLEPLCLEPNNNTQVISNIIYIKDLPYLLVEMYA
jgi:hypothetical protein